VSAPSPMYEDRWSSWWDSSSLACAWDMSVKIRQKEELRSSRIAVLGPKKAIHASKHGRLVAVQDITIFGIAGALKMEGG